MGFTGFYQLVLERQALIRNCLGEIYGYGEKRDLDESKS